MEFDESRHGADVAITLAPARFEGGLFPFAHLEAVHGDEHGMGLRAIVSHRGRHRADEGVRADRVTASTSRSRPWPDRRRASATTCTAASGDSPRGTPPTPPGGRAG